ncbi:O-Glycosyl hydrolase [Bryocella elongata]|uniref:O-Glycosyl hydrolase n=1 Tax=Bryocella elongata TaxID=863522 RepID=A0A1H5WRN1_9BACT|nr:glycoside hydrolase family 30 beta sandwich domain-containing protein [Bryocella elongata]SEG02005.1 O-Glycosyl hydrolase [Bryocella elongata]
MKRYAFLLSALSLAALPSLAQVAVSVPAFHASAAEAQQSFRFVADGPKGPGWTRPDEIARVYFPEPLPAFFTRTLELDAPIPDGGSLEWIFTGPHAGFTVTLTPTTVRLNERYYNSVALSDGGTYPSKTIAEESRAYTGAARSLRVVVDSHLSVNVQLNGETILTAHLVFDLTRHQLMYRAPRTHHDVVTGHLLKPEIAQATLTVHPEEHRQTMLGFGGSPSVPAYAGLSAAGKRQYWEMMKRYNLLLDREYPMGTELKRDLSNIDTLADATPHYYGDNFPNGEVSDFDYSKHALALGGEVIYEMWALPTWAIVPWKPAPGQPEVMDAWNRYVREAADPDVYAKIVVGYCKALKAHTGAAPAIVGVQNEVEQPPEIFAKMTTTLRRELDAAGFTSTQIHMADAPYVSMAIGRVNDLKRDAAAWKATDYVTAHQYDYQGFLANPDLYDARLKKLHDASPDKAFLATEICLNDGNAQEPSYRLAFQVGQLYHKDLVELDAEALMYCWLLLDVEQPTFGGSRSLLVPDRTHGDVPVASSFQLRVMGAFSRHVRKGMKRVDVATGDADVMATAFVGADHAATLVVMNRSTKPTTLHLDWAQAPVFRTLERTSTYADNQVETITSLERLVIAPGEILTLTTEAVQ